MRLSPWSVFFILATAPILAAQQEPRALEREILKQLIEINTSDSARHTDLAAKAMAERLTSAGLPADDVRLIETAVARLLAGRTSIVIAHRLATIRRVDRIVVIHHGEVRETGTHAELLAADGLYARLYQLQFADQSASDAARLAEAR